jgi:D-glycero-D-manno-heptose 1,7-bisphosphate phosphatase
MKNPEIVVMVGIPGCGKSTFQERFLPYHHRVNLDSIHLFLDPEKGFDKSNFSLGRNIEDLIIEDRLKQGISVVIDNTNITRKKRGKYIEFGKKYCADVRAVYFEPDFELAWKQNNERERKVPIEAIKKMEKDFEMPSSEEGFSRIFDAKNPAGLIGRKSVVFLDRDGVIFKNKLDGKDLFINKTKDIFYLENSIEGLMEVTKKGYEIFVISNQGGVGLGYMKPETLEEINDKMKSDLEGGGVKLSGVYCCTHKPSDNCKCRKPNTGLIIGASREHDIDPTASYMIGDMTSDIELGKRVLAKTVLVETGFGGTDNKYAAVSDYKVKDLLEFSMLVGRQ